MSGNKKPPPTPCLPGMFDVPKSVDVSAPAYEVPSHRIGPETSRASTIHFEGHVGAQRQAVYEAIKAAGDDGMTSWEVAQAACGGLIQSASGRLFELAGKYRKWPWQFIRDSGRRRTTGTGSTAIVWVALPEPVYVGNGGPA